MTNTEHHGSYERDGGHQCREPHDRIISLLYPRLTNGSLFLWSVCNWAY